ncbi:MULTISPECIES: hypothetical protein [unclassified Flavobacterium]|uniref:hypothetical protein n=1 Tax=unclassified Flavobacterium TaxID=196869 RepID=UPI00057CE68F|nr:MULTISPECIES: hypothetical protein [unclassified Flavobacterium]KIA92680.1 hypothetical protein OA93_23030 [Flavobacterium sp. KMS]OUL62519.1 hypothetical protein B8T70_09970 [Flavobacterium sp. AJR]
MKEIKHYYSLSSQWQHSFANAIGVKIFDNKIIIIPETLGKGYIYFAEVTNGVSALFKDYTLTSPIKIRKFMSEEEFYILHYTPARNEDLNFGTEDVINLDLSILNNQAEELYESDVNERMFGFSLFIDKKIMHDFAGKMPHFELINKKLNNTEGSYYGCIDRNSLMLILSLKKKSIFHSSFDYYLKGISYKLLANFLSCTIDLTSM